MGDAKIIGWAILALAGAVLTGAGLIARGVATGNLGTIELAQQLGSMLTVLGVIGFIVSQWRKQ